MCVSLELQIQRQKLADNFEDHEDPLVPDTGVRASKAIIVGEAHTVGNGRGFDLEDVIEHLPSSVASLPKCVHRVV